MLGIFGVVVVLAVVELPIFIWFCKKRQITRLLPVAAWAFLIYAGQALLLALALIAWDRPGWQLDVVGSILIFALYGVVLFSPIYGLLVAIAYWRLRGLVGTSQIGKKPLNKPAQTTT